MRPAGALLDGLRPQLNLNPTGRTNDGVPPGPHPLIPLGYRRHCNGVTPGDRAVEGQWSLANPVAFREPLRTPWS
eukprot:1383360-Alexandrium_andersonii.AAC.1